MTAMEVIPFVHEGLGNSSYLFNVGPGIAALIDPDRNIERYLEAADARGWEVREVLETHLHADFVSGVREMLDRRGIDPIVPADARDEFAHRAVTHDERLRIGDVEIEVVGSPGHTPEHVSYIARSADAAPLLFSGGSLIVGGAARTDLISSDLTESLARRQFRTLRRAFTTLPDETVVLPTHGGGSYCSIGSREVRASTLGDERRRNPILLEADEDAFVRWFTSSFPSVPDYFFRLREVNRKGPRPRADIPPPAPLGPDAFARAIHDGALVVDLRPAESFAAGHIPASLSIPLRDAYPTWLGWLVSPETELLFVSERTQSLERVVQESLLVGYERFRGSLEGGFDAWRQSGGDVSTFGLLEPASASDALADGAVALDVREPVETAADRIPAALAIPLGRLRSEIEHIPEAEPIIAYCGHGERASTALSLLERAGRGRLSNLRGGLSAWKEVGLPVSPGQ